jgi:hypothetical protein
MSQTPNSPSSSRPLPRIPVQVEQDEYVDIVEDLDRGGEERRGKSGEKGRSQRLRKKDRHPDLRGKELQRGMFYSRINLLKLMIKMLFCAI